MRRQTVRQDAPALCLLFAILFALLAGALLFAWRLDVPASQSLRSVAGRVEQVSHVIGPKVGRKIQITVREGTHLHHITQDDPSDALPAMKTIRLGDSIVALTAPDSLGRDLEWLWGLRRADQELLSYRDVLDIKQAKAQRAQPVAYSAAVLSALLLGCAFILRRHFGRWR